MPNLFCLLLLGAIIPLVPGEHAPDSIEFAPSAHGLSPPARDLQDDFLYILERAVRGSLPEGSYCENDLGITKNAIDLFWKEGLPGKNPNNKATTMTLFSSKLVFPNTQDAFKDVLDGEDNQLSLLTKNAHLAMNKIGNSENQGTVMTAMAIDKSIYLSSSIKGKKIGNLIVDVESWKWRPNVPEQLKDCLQRCQEWWEETNPGADPNYNPDDPRSHPDYIHKNRASCGECSALYQFFQENPTRKDCNNAVFSSTSASVSKDDKDLPFEKKLHVVNPCGVLPGTDGPQGQRWGCALLTSMCGNSRFVKEGPDPYNQFSEYYIGPWKRIIKVNGEEKVEREKDADYRKSTRFFEKSFVPLDIGTLRVFD